MKATWALMFLFGLALLVFGMWLVWYPLGPITAGVGVMFVAALGASAEKGGAASEAALLAALQKIVDLRRHRTNGSFESIADEMKNIAFDAIERQKDGAQC